MQKINTSGHLNSDKKKLLNKNRIKKATDKEKIPYLTKKITIITKKKGKRFKGIEGLFGDAARER